MANVAIVSIPTFFVGGSVVSLGTKEMGAGFSWVVFNGKGLFGPPSFRLSCTLRRETF